MAGVQVQVPAGRREGLVQAVAGATGPQPDEAAGGFQREPGELAHMPKRDALGGGRRQNPVADGALSGSGDPLNGQQHDSHARRGAVAVTVSAISQLMNLPTRPLVTGSVP